MESRHRILFLTAGMLALTAANAVAAPPAPLNFSDPDTAVVVEPEVERREINVAAIDTEDFEIGAYAGYMTVEDFGSNAVYGGRLVYHVSEDFFTEAAFGQTEAGKTSYETLSGSAELLSGDERRFRYLTLSAGYNLLPGEAFIGSRHAFNSALYLKGGIGVVQFAGDNHHSINLGIGYRLLPLDWLAVHVNVDDHLFNSDLLGKDKTTNNIEVSAGLSVFF